MEIPYKIEGPKEIGYEKLLLWPNNPRLKVSDFSEVKYTEKQLIQPANQEKIFRLLSKHEDHDVVSLINSMRKVGFMREKAPIVMKINGTEKYLVLEGNRRLTAIKTILSEHKNRIPERREASLREIPCWIFEHTSKDVPLKAAISRMVAEAHIKGQKPHSKLQRAHMLYDAYEGFLSEKTDGQGFHLDNAALAETSNFFDIPAKDLEYELSVVRLYKQLVDAYKPEDIPKKCSERLSWVHKHSKHFGTYFGYDSDSLSFDEEGLDRFYETFLHPDAAVYNPSTFRKFVEIMRNGAAEDIEIIRDEPEMFDEVYKRVKDDLAEGRFLSGLEGVEKKLSSLRISDYKKTNDERKAIERIILLVDKKLKRMISGFESEIETEPVRSGRFRRPSNIEEAMALDYEVVACQVEKLVKGKPNSSCMRERVATYLLKEWSVVSRGRPREAFCDWIDEVVGQMADEGRIEIYRAKNERVRV